ncbi:hypothetical protein [Knoellia aerolata]|uniref:Uncharacterized protein n=1 Tax=Knoellia aerolata DSM 18566 TaxID=1385519 RepID=A0A0A0JU13_9MICO|nr:hypothetical protein [Knoellia aerolata]KGN40199.1 hypothetical protein N801_16155 [Knoellia aerolata DSM 18566]
MSVLVACGSSPPVADTPGPEASPSESTGTDCGEVVLRQGEQLEVAGATQRACLEEALREGRGATLTVTETTTEGDPVVTSWRLDDDGSLSGDVDATKDAFAGSLRTYSVSCGRITTLPTPLVCDSIGS